MDGRRPHERPFVTQSQPKECEISCSCLLCSYHETEHTSRLTSVPFVIIPGVGHQAGVWRAALVPMFSWMTPQLAWEAATADAAEAAAAKAAAYRKAHLPKPRPVRTPGPQKK